MEQFIFYHGPVNIQGARNLETLLTAAAAKENPKITLCICSGGGDVCAGIGVYNFIKMLPVQVTTYTFGICGSIAATMFLSGTSRIAASTSMFSLHAATYVEGPRIGEISENTKIISQPFSQKLEWTEERIEKYFSSPQEQFISPEQAVEMSIVTEIKDIVMSSADEIIHVNIPS